LGESPESFADAVKEAASEAAKTSRAIGWFEVAHLRRRITKKKVEFLHLLIEPSGAAVIASLDRSYQPRKEENLVLVVSGGNKSLDRRMSENA
jgi:flavin-binding protein dodecin